MRGTAIFVALAAFGFSACRTAEPAVPGPRIWHLAAMNNVAVLGEAPLTLGFADGRVLGDSGCNRFSGAVSRDGLQLSIGPLMSTKRGCSDPSLMSQESDYLRALESATIIAEGRENGGSLVISGGSARLVFLPAP